MKKILYCIIVFSFLIIPFSAQSYTINDTGAAAYWGGNVVNAGSTAYGDVIGSPYFNVDQMNVTRSGNVWTVTLSGPYFQYRQNPSIDGGFPSTYGPGDLYINSKGWKATQDASGHYSTDVFSSSEGWDYVVTQSPTGGWGLYTLDYNKITYTNAPSNYIYRSGQAWRGGAGTYIGSATYTLNNTLTFSFNTGTLDWTGPVGFHWDMKCGNDVVEGKVPGVPEPTTILLLGLGLMGVAGVRRKFQN
jgi:hypothetical protein